MAGANVHGTCFHPLIDQWKKTMIVLGDQGFKARQGNSLNIKTCDKGTWNERMIIETVLAH